MKIESAVVAVLINKVAQEVGKEVEYAGENRPQEGSKEDDNDEEEEEEEDDDIVIESIRDSNARVDPQGDPQDTSRNMLLTYHKKLKAAREKYPFHLAFRSKKFLYLRRCPEQ